MGASQLYDGEKFQAVAAHGILEAFANQRQGFVLGPNHPSDNCWKAPLRSSPDRADDDPIVRAAFELSGIRTCCSFLCVGR